MNYQNGLLGAPLKHIKKHDFLSSGRTLEKKPTFDPVK